MRSSSACAVVLAAGQGTRMKSELPKVLHRVGGKPMLCHVLGALGNVSPAPAPVVVVIGPDAEKVEAAAIETAEDRFGDGLSFVTQHERLGTAHACQQARQACAGRAKAVLVLYGDVPLLSSGSVARLVNGHAEAGAAITFLTTVVADATGYGRVVRSRDGEVVKVVEHKDASPAELEIREVNAGVYAFDDEWLWPELARLEPSPSGEIYLTDLIGRAVASRRSVVGICVDDSLEVAGVNTVRELEIADRELTRRSEQASVAATEAALKDGPGSGSSRGQERWKS